MKLSSFSAGIAAVVLSVVLPLSSQQKFEGTWCVSDEGLVITFQNEDSLSIASLRDESVSGNGTYSVKDTVLVASIESEDLTMEMGYHYKWRSDSLIRARILYFTLNGDSVNHPHHWLKMSRCEGISPKQETKLAPENDN